MSATLTTLGPLAVAVFGAVAALALDAWASRRSAALVATVALGASAALAAVGVGLKTQSVIGVLGAGGGFASIAATVYAAGALSMLAGVSELSDHPKGGVLAALCAFAVSGAAAAAISLDFVALILAVETASLCAYAIVALGTRRGATEAAVKYFVQGSLATGLLAMATAVLVGALAGGTSYGAIVQAAAKGSPSLLMSGVLLATAGLAFKAGAFPFHSWAPDAYEQAPHAGAGVLASAVKAGALLALTVLVLVLSPTNADPMPVAALSLGSIVFGNLAALKQRSFTRMLAYSGIAQVGYALVAVVAGATAEAVFIVATYAVAVAGAFAAAGAYKRANPAWDESIEGLAGFGARHPFVSAALVVILLSLVGVPPLFGFWGKFFAFRAAIATGWAWLALAGLLGSVVSFGYYGGVLRSLYFEELPEGAQDEPEVPSEGSAKFSVAASAAIIVLGGAGVLVGGARVVMALFGAR